MPEPMIIEVEKGRDSKVGCPFNAVSLYRPWCVMLKIQCYGSYWDEIPADCPLLKGDVTVRFAKEKR